MKIISIELREYAKLNLNNIQKIKIKFENKIHLFIGTNGSGKSALMRELTPLPANPDHYGPNGFKCIEISSKGHHYLLTCDFGQIKKVYSFLKDGEEMNPGLGVSDYRKLVFKEFGITPGIHDVMTGRNRFHLMSTGECRAWFTMISDSDYTYAIQYYKRLSDRYRDLQGALKLNQSRMVQEKTKCLAPEEEQALRKEVKQLNQVVHDLIEKRPNIQAVTDQSTEAQLNQVTRSLRDHYRSYAVHLSVSLPDYHSEGLDEILIQVQARITSLNQQAQVTFDELDKLRTTIEQLQHAGVSDPADITSEIAKVTTEIRDLTRLLSFADLTFDDPVLALGAHASVFDTLKDLLHDLKADPDKLITRVSYQAKLQIQLRLTEEVNLLARDHEALNAKLKAFEHAKLHNRQECPACKHQWFSGYSESEYSTALKQRDAMGEVLVKKEAQLVQGKEQLDSEEHYLHKLTSLNQLINAWPVLTPFWTLAISKEAWIRNSPQKALHAFFELKGDLEVQIRLATANKHLQELENLKQLSLQAQQSNLEGLQLQAARLDAKLHSEQAELKELNTHKAVTVAQRNTLNQIFSLSDKLTGLLTRSDAIFKETVLKLEREYFNDVIRAVQAEAIEKEQAISRVDQQNNLVRDLESQNVQLLAQAGLLNLAMQELSPSKGLIAKGMSGFINHFVHQVNAFIKKIWLYPLELVPIIPDEDTGLDLDYRFSMLVGDARTKVDDIRDASSAQLEVIDLAFNIISMKYLGLEHAALYLDEFASSMDHAHRQSAFHVITNLFASAEFSQIFMVSHNETNYGALVNADVTVLHPHNIVLPKDLAYNQVTTIE